MVNPEFEWVFTEEVIYVYWLSKWYDKIAIVDERYNWWRNINMTGNAFQYNHTYALMTRWQWGWMYQEHVDRTMHWFFMDVFIGEFDNYVEINMINPKLNLENRLGIIQIAYTSTTIAILLLGFLIDFEPGKRGWKNAYMAIAVITMFSSLMFTIFTFI